MSIIIIIIIFIMTSISSMVVIFTITIIIIIIISREFDAIKRVSGPRLGSRFASAREVRGV